MSADTRELSHPAARAAHALLEANRLVSAALVAYSPAESAFTLAESLARLIVPVPEDIAALYADGEAKAADLAELRDELCRMAQYIVRLEDANTRHMITESDLKTRLARAAENNEELYRLTSHAVGDATERHLIVSRNRALLDLEIPLPPVKAVAISTPTHYGAPRAAASH